MLLKKVPRKISVHYLGLIGYEEGLTFQQQAEKVLKTNVESGDASISHGTLLIAEHKPVFTVGIRSKEYGEEVEEKLLKTNAEFYRTNRGGLITFHGPGQLVAYPILYLKYFNLSLRCYISKLESTIIQLCNLYGIQGYTSPLTGVWVNEKKICAIGVHASRYVTTHGIGLNCNTDLNWFSHIEPCGIKDKGVTSLSEELARNVDIKEVLPQFIECFSETFNTEVIGVS